MATLREWNGSYRVILNYRGKQPALTLGRVAESEANAALVDDLLLRLKQGLIEMPPGIDVVTILRHDGGTSPRPIRLPYPAAGADNRRASRSRLRYAREWA